MTLPITAYGDPILRKVAQPITADYPDLQGLIDNMFETMYHSHGVGLAAPQVNLSIRLFVIDSTPMFEDEDGNLPPVHQAVKRVFINAQMLKNEGSPWSYTEGCLSLPGIREGVKRPPEILIRYCNENFEWKEERFDGLNARVIQHEYDHLEGKLFIDYLSPLKKRLISRRLDRIVNGDVKVNYLMRFLPNKKR